MKLLFLFLLLPACIQAQKIGDTRTVRTKLQYHFKIVNGYAKQEFYQIVLPIHKWDDEGNDVYDTLRGDPFWVNTEQYFYLQGKKIIIPPTYTKGPFKSYLGTNFGQGIDYAPAEDVKYKGYPRYYRF